MNLSDIATQLIFTTVPIYVEKNNGTNMTGTGFVYQKKIDDKRSIPFIVTNRHVVENASKGLINFIKRNEAAPVLSERITVEIPGAVLTQFMDSKNDLAIFAIGPMLNQLEANGVSVFFRSIEQNLIPNKEVVNNLSAIEEITFIGYPSGIIDMKNNTPIVRKGITASPIWNDFGGNDVFLIDAGVYPGSSGSPVFILNVGSYSSNDGIILGSRILFLGLISGTMQRNENGNQVYLGLGQVVKSSVMQEFIDKVCSSIDIV